MARRAPQSECPGRQWRMLTTTQSHSVQQWELIRRNCAVCYDSGWCSQCQYYSGGRCKIKWHLLAESIHHIFSHWWYIIAHPSLSDNYTTGMRDHSIWSSDRHIQNSTTSGDTMDSELIFSHHLNDCLNWQDWENNVLYVHVMILSVHTHWGIVWEETCCCYLWEYDMWIPPPQQSLTLSSH